MKTRNPITVLLIVFLLLAAVAGGLLLMQPMLNDMRRGDAQQELLEQIESGKAVIELSDVPEVEGEEADGERTENIQIVNYGVIEIPSIDLRMPLARGADKQSLRVAAGWYPDSAEVGGAGNAVILGHRMTGYGVHFNRLDELQAGDQVVITTSQSEVFTYTVTGSEVILPENLMHTLAEHNEGFILTLVTCTPTGVGSHRLLVYATLTDSAAQNAAE